MAKNTNTFQNNIKNYDIIRKVIRHIYMYGNYSKGDIIKNNIVKSERSLYNILRRLENYLDGEYLQTHKLPNRKRDKSGYRFKYDPFLCPINYLADTYQNCSYVIEDFIFYFTFMQSLKDYSKANSYSHLGLSQNTYEVSELTIESEFDYDQIICNIKDVLEANTKVFLLLNQFCSYTINADNLFTPSKALARFNELLELGLIEKISLDTYKVTKDIFNELSLDELSSLQLMIQFFYNCSYLCIPGYHLSATINGYIISHYFKSSSTFFNKQSNPVFFYKNNHLQNVIDDDILWFILRAIHELNAIHYTYHTKKGTLVNVDAFPIKIVIEKQYGRHYFYGYNYGYNCYFMQRIDAISDLKISTDYNNETKLSFIPSSSATPHEILDKLYQDKMKGVWNIATGDTVTTVLIHFSFPINEYSKYLNYLKTTGRHGTITITGETTLDYSITVQNELEMVTWLRSFGKYAVVDKTLNPTLYNKMKSDFKETLEKYGFI